LASSEEKSNLHKHGLGQRVIGTCHLLLLYRFNMSWSKNIVEMARVTFCARMSPTLSRKPLDSRSWNRSMAALPLKHATDRVWRASSR
jgi:hypothetical protein